MQSENIAVRRLIANFTETLASDHVENGLREVVFDLAA
jgi:hypothetical protein